MAIQQKPGGKTPTAATATAPAAVKTAPKPPPPEATASDQDAPPTGNGASRALASFKTILKTVPLNQLIIRTEKFSFRAKEAFAMEALRPLIESIRESGIKHPPEVYWDEEEKAFVLVTGHRRLNSLLKLVEDGVFGFTPDMLVQVRVLENTTYLERLAWACADNETRLNFSANERIVVAKRFLVAGMPDIQGAIALGISLKQYRRDLMIVRNDWMIAHITEEEIPATVAVELLEACVKRNRFEDLKEHLTNWVLEQRIDIEAADTLTKIRPSEKLVKSRLTKVLKDHWISLLESGKYLDNRVPSRLPRMNVDKVTHEVEIDSIRENIMTMPLSRATQVFSRLQTLLDIIGAILRRRAAFEADSDSTELEPQKGGPIPLSSGFLKNFNLEKFADQPSSDGPSEPEQIEENADNGSTESTETDGNEVE